MPVADPRNRGAADPGLVAQGLVPGRSTLRVDTPSIHAEQPAAYRALSTRRRGWSREGKKDPVRSLGMANSTSPAVVASFLGLVPLRLLVRSGVRDVALRADHGGGLGINQAPATRPEADDGTHPSSKIGVGQDFPDQRGHGPLVTGHRGRTPCESWSKNRAPTMPPPMPTAPRGPPGGSPRELPPHYETRPPRLPTRKTRTNARPHPAGWGTTPIPEEGLWTRKGWAGRTH